ncbi:MAG: hypothetical protein Q8P66_01805 [Candidatus Colwellbacteria bacterium]|nr:hypothetical protein [Candidatus Colwellbacteria bacterium]
MLETLLGFWWLPILVAIVILFRGWWLSSKINQYINAIQWVILEIRIPKDNLKSIKSMEQVFASLHGTYSQGIKRRERWLGGKVEDWISLEIAGFAHSIHFYIRTPTKYRKLVEAALFSQYPDAEIEEVEDYTALLPRDIPNNDFDIWGTDYVLARDNAYPIKTYPNFEQILQFEELGIDPLATLIEVISNLKNNELIWLQFLVRPLGSEWISQVKGTVDALAGKKGGGGGFFGSIVEFSRNLAAAPVTHPEWGGGESPPAPSERLTPGKQDTLKAVEGKMSKLAFDATLRFIYIDKKDEFTGENVTAVVGAINQFAALNLNAFKPNMKTITIPTKVGLFNRKERLVKRKKLLFQHYLFRDIAQPPPFRFGLKLKTSILNAEELATIYHPPLAMVSAAKLRVLETRKGEPPVNLPLVEE